LVEGQYVLRGDNRIAFQLAPYDRRRPVVIDPVLAYSTYLGEFGVEWGKDGGIAVDSSGNAYMTGSTSSSDFPTTSGAFQTALRGYGNAFVSKLNAAGSAVVYSTYLGGSHWEGGSSIPVDASGNAFVTGVTSSSDFPTTPGAFQTAYKGPEGNCVNCGDGFVTKLNANGSALVYSTYLGGSDIDFALGMAIDASGNAYVTGATYSSDFPVTPGAFDTTFNGAAFVTKLNTTGSALIYSTYLGGTNGAGGIAVDASGNAYVAGTGGPPNFLTTPGAFQTSCVEGGCAFVSKLNSAGSGPAYSTYLGPTYTSSGEAIAVDAAGKAYITGPVYPPRISRPHQALSRLRPGGALTEPNAWMPL
jgi:hypothetical protein